MQTVDFFTPIVDDAYAWGWIAAANALSDVYAMGGRPVTALNLVAWPRSLGFELLGRVLEGGAAACASAGVAIVGGHSVDDPEPKYGLAVTGTIDPRQVVLTAGASPGADLVLTKALGTGIISSALKEGKASSPEIDAAIASMSELNRGAAETMVQIGVQAATDVTGFGLVGHLLEMLGTKLSAQLWFDAIPVLEGAVEHAGAGVYPGGSRRNYETSRDRVAAGGLGEGERLVLFDAQTSGGLLIAVDPVRTPVLLKRLTENGVTRASVVGRVDEGDGGIEVA